MWMWGAVGVMAGMIAGMASTLGGGVVGGFSSRRVHWHVGGFRNRPLVGRFVGGARGLQLLATTVSSS